ncbi:MAG: SDR family oxidoreductase [Actinocrinis sp.]
MPGSATDRAASTASTDPSTSSISPDAVALPLEVTDPQSAAKLAELAPDVTILINNAGRFTGASFLSSPLEDIESDLKVNFYGPLYVTRALAPVIERNGGGHILNVHSVLSWVAFPGLEAYSAAKAAVWSQTNALRLALKPRGIAVTGLHVGYVDTDFAEAVTAPKVASSAVATAALDGIETDAPEVLVDELSRNVKAGLAADITALYPQVA